MNFVLQLLPVVLQPYCLAGDRTCGYIDANLEAVFVQVESVWGLMWANVRYEG